MRDRSVICAPGGISGEHISLKITGGCQCREPMWCSRSFTPPPAPSMVTRNVILSVSEESGEEGRDNGPRTRLFCIALCLSGLQKKLMFAVRRASLRTGQQSVRDNKTTKSKTHTFPGDPENIIIFVSYPYVMKGKEIFNEAEVKF